MPVLVTGAEHGLGAAVTEQLLAAGGEVRAFLDATSVGDDVAAALRARGCKVAVGELDDEGHMEAALAQVHTVAHCVVGPLEDPAAQVADAATLASALLGAGVRRLVWVRELAADPANPYLAALDEIDDLFEDLPVETVTLSTAVRYGPADPLTRRLAAGWVPATAVDLDTPHAPIHLGDVARAVIAADRQRAAAADLHMRLGLVGPEAMSLGELLARLGAPAEEPAARRADAAPAWLTDWLSHAAVAPPDGPAPMNVARGAIHLPTPAAR
ncbi:MAG TPA: NmrA family NAD(P)-binding protein [Euzebyales bacterium]